ncbi:hypothetical protein [Nitrobacter sp.]|uniref:hypothetical protein n=1 Tax=Nitrobacter sp. TaxID=29420 RepID=UPI003F64D3E5
MPRHHQPAKHPGGSQRQLRVGLATLVSALAVTSPASAEVCDKAIGDSWRAANGPVWLLNPQGFSFCAIILISALLVIFVTRKPILAYVASGLALLYGAVILASDVVLQHDLYLSELREGCRSVRTDLADVAILAAFVIVCASLGLRFRRHNAKTI